MDQDLLNKYIKGEILSQDEEKVISLWLQESSENVKLYKNLHKIEDIVLWNEDVFNIEAIQEGNTNKKNKVKRYLLSLSKYAAVFLLSLVLSYFFIQSFSPIEENDASLSNSIFVPPGQRVEITLVDGTKVWLNAKTHFTFPEKFTDKSRNVYLDGEAYFDVAENAEVPFIVKTNNYSIKVLGTEFNVVAYKYAEIFNTSLIEGSVEIFSEDQKHLCILSPNQMAYSTNSNELITSSIQDHNFLLWKEGIIYFDNETVENIIKKLELYFDVKIKVDKKSLLSHNYSGKFRVNDGVEQVLKVLQLKHNFKYIRDDANNTITILN